MGRYDFLVPASTSLKDKRRVIRRLTDTIRSKFNLSIAEVDYQDLRQRGAIGVSCVSNSSFHAKKMLHELDRFLLGQHSIELVNAEIEVTTLDA
jgi:uncharacterized protein YlxP (DUF503 family)